MDTPPLKRCPMCGRDLPHTLDYYYRTARRKDGLAYACKDCSKTRVKAWKQANAERWAATQRQYRATHKAEHAAHQRRYRAKHPDRIRAKKQQYRARRKARDAGKE